VKRAAIPLTVLWIASLLAVAGCGGSDSDSKTGKKSAATEDKIEVVSLSELPPLLDHMPPMDDGRVEVARPKDWNVRGHPKGYLVMFYAGTSSGPPRILVGAEEAKGSSFRNVNRSNMEEFKNLIKADVKSKLLTNEKLKKRVELIIIGDRPWTSYIRKGKFNKAAIEQLILQTLVEGRIYTVKLQVYSGNVGDHRKTAYAVAGGLKFAKSAAEPEPAPPEKTPPDDPTDDDPPPDAPADPS